MRRLATGGCERAIPGPRRRKIEMSRLCSLGFPESRLAKWASKSFAGGKIAQKKDPKSLQSEATKSFSINTGIPKTLKSEAKKAGVGGQGRGAGNGERLIGSPPLVGLSARSGKIGEVARRPLVGCVNFASQST